MNVVNKNSKVAMVVKVKKEGVMLTNLKLNILKKYRRPGEEWQPTSLKEFLTNMDGYYRLHTAYNKLINNERLKNPFVIYKLAREAN